MLAKQTSKIACLRRQIRCFAIRQADTPPLQFQKRVSVRSFVNWKIATIALIAGAGLAYNETLFEKYAEYTSIGDEELHKIQLEYKLKTLPLYQKLSNCPKDWIKMSSWENLDRNILDGNGNNVQVKNIVDDKNPSLTSHTLAQPGGISIAPIIFYNPQSGKTITMVHMGYRLCGYPFLVHGGILATLLNETFKRNASFTGGSKSTLKDDFMVEKLSISYRSPTLANQFLTVKTSKAETHPDPTVATYKSVIEDENGKVLVESEAVLRNTGRATHRESMSRASSWVLF